MYGDMRNIQRMVDLLSQPGGALDPRAPYVGRKPWSDEQIRRQNRKAKPARPLSIGPPSVTDPRIAGLGAGNMNITGYGTFGMPPRRKVR